MRLSAYSALLLAFTFGCDPSAKVGTFSFGNTESIVVVDPKGVAIPRLILLDKEGEALPVPETLTYTLDPPGIARLQDKTVLAVKKGEAVLTARFGPKGPTVALSVVSRPLDQIVVRCPETPCVVKPDQPVKLEARPSSGGDEVDKVAITWESADPEIVEVDADGMVKGKKAGRTMIRATAFGVTGTGEVVVRAPADKLEVFCPWPPFRLTPTDDPESLPGSCQVRVGSPVELAVVTHAGGEVVTDRDVSYVSSQPQVMEVVNAELAGMAPGAGVVQISVEDLRLSIPVQVQKKGHRFTVQGRRCTGEMNKPIEVGEFKFNCANKKFGEKCMKGAGILAEKRDFSFSDGFLRTLSAPCCCEPTK